MADRRVDAFSGRVVLVAPERLAAARVDPDPGAGLPALRGPCPFCPGNESLCGPEQARWPARGAWRVRSVANRWPLRLATIRGERTEAGAHEVIVDSPGHDEDLPDLPTARLAEWLGALRDRTAAHERRAGVRAVALFRNRGRRAGSSQPHPHSQLVALPFVPPDVGRRAALARAAWNEHGRSLLALELERARDDGRVVLASKTAIAWAPHAPQQSDAVLVGPRPGSAADRPWSALAGGALRGVASVLGDTLRRLLHVTRNPDYNVVWHLPPTEHARRPWAFWLIELVPRRAAGAGFELVTGMGLVVRTPEQTAAALRDAAPRAGRRRTGRVGQGAHTRRLAPGPRA
ncbi:MAG: hypothetical protein NZ898_12030 [Myxococcota bacterium]|nr:hypothetical protein [Myxococcota bacterium]MDW8360923.1 hypothetical protein [Myxococcales bacterium]